MQVLIDTNVVLDVLLNRDDFVRDAVAILKLPESSVQKYVSASAITDIYYIARQEIKDKAEVKNLLKTLLQIIHVADLSEAHKISAFHQNQPNQHFFLWHPSSIEWVAKKFCGGSPLIPISMSELSSAPPVTCEPKI